MIYRSAVLQIKVRKTVWDNAFFSYTLEIKIFKLKTVSVSSKSRESERKGILQKIFAKSNMSQGSMMKEKPACRREGRDFK